MVTQRMIDSVSTAEIVEIADRAISLVLAGFQERIGQKDGAVGSEFLRLKGRPLQADLVRFGREYLAAERAKAEAPPPPPRRIKPFPTADSIVDYAKAAIVEDCVSGLVPVGRIRTYQDLFDHVDANEYLGVTLPHDKEDLEDALKVCDDAIQRLDIWIKRGGLRGDVIVSKAQGAIESGSASKV